MRASTFGLGVGDGVELHVYRWEPDDGAPKAVLVIAHGMAEHGARYARFAEALTAAGYAVYAADQRGHGLTATTPGDFGYFADAEGWRRVVDDLYAVNRRAASDHPETPIFVLGHSMGSFVVETYLFSHGDSVTGAILSGPTAAGATAGRTGVAVCRVERLRLGPRGRSPIFKLTSFDAFNWKFRPNRTEADFISRDEAEVDAYLADPLCGFELTVQAWSDVYRGMILNDTQANVARVPRELPVLVFAGGEDPVGGPRGVARVSGAYRRAGLTDVSERVYDGGRHEMLNETNRDQVTRDVIAWMDGALLRRASG